MSETNTTNNAENKSKSAFETLNDELTSLAEKTSKTIGALGLEAGKEYNKGFAAGLQGVEKTVTNLSNTFSAFSDFKGSLDWPKTTGLTFIQ